MEKEVLLEQFNTTIGAWITCLDDYTFEMLCRKPLSTSWSLGQVYMHIVNDTTFFVSQIKACLLNNNTDSEKQMHDNAKSIFANGFPDMLITGPATNDSVPQPQSKEELLAGLLSIQKDVNELCAAHDLPAAKGKTRHPGLLFFNASEWLRFADLHMRHHFRQKKRIDTQLGFNISGADVKETPKSLS
jgi:hypothetical protein